MSHNRLIKNGKYFVAPQKFSDNFKVLFSRLTAEGAGRPVDSQGFPDGSWTADLLVEAICAIEGNENGIELRSVQVWFQDNEHGISVTNIRWLARIFGCNDPEATSLWQAELSASKERLARGRRAKRKSATKPALHDQPIYDATLKDEQSCSARGNSVLSPDTNLSAIPSKPKPNTPTVNRRRFSLARTSESLFCGSPFNLPSSVFAGAVALGFMSYFLGIHGATFDAPDGQIKQVGFLWAPNWTILFMAFMPLFFAAVAELLVFWKEEGRMRVAPHDDRMGSADGWMRNVEAASYTFWAVFMICLLFAGVFQWIDVRLLPLMHGGEDYATDWGSLALKHPEVISVPKAIAFTGFAYLYMCICFYLFFVALILLFSVAQDFANVQAKSYLEQNRGHQNEINAISDRLMRGIFRCAVLGVLIALCMKLQSTYLTSSGTNMVGWLIADMTSIFNEGSEFHNTADYSSPNHFSSLLIVLASVFVFLYGGSQLNLGNRFNVSLGMMVATVGLLVVSYLLIDAFAGFSILLSLAVLFAIYGLLDPWFGTREARELGGNQSVL